MLTSYKKEKYITGVHIITTLNYNKHLEVWSIQRYRRFDFNFKYNLNSYLFIENYEHFALISKFINLAQQYYKYLKTRFFNFCVKPLLTERTRFVQFLISLL